MICRLDALCGARKQTRSVAILPMPYFHISSFSNQLIFCGHLCTEGHKPHTPSPNDLVSYLLANGFIVFVTVIVVCIVDTPYRRKPAGALLLLLPPRRSLWKARNFLMFFVSSRRRLPNTSAQYRKMVWWTPTSQSSRAHSSTRHAIRSKRAARAAGRFCAPRATIKRSRRSVANSGANSFSRG